MTSGFGTTFDTPMHPLRSVKRPDLLDKKKIIVIEHLIEGTPEAEIYRFDKDRLVLGGVGSADLRLTGEGVAPIHAVVELIEDLEEGAELDPAYKDAQGVIYDLASDTGVFVNGQRVITRPLKGGEEIVIGRHKLKFGIVSFADAAKRGTVTDTVEGDRALFLQPSEDLSPLLLEDESNVSKIFDYRPTSKDALEVIMAWYDLILDVEHFVDEKAVTLGQKQTDSFGIPPLLSDSRFKIVTKMGDSFVLNLGANETALDGVLQRKGKLYRFKELRAGRLREVTDTGNGFQLILDKDDFVKATVGEIDFYLSFTKAPPTLLPRKLLDRDPFFISIFGASIALTVLLLAVVAMIPVPQTIEVEKLPDRIATILYQPEKYENKIKRPVTPAPKELAQVEKVQPPKPVPPKPTPPKKVKIDLKPEPVDLKKPIPKELVIAKAQNKPKPTPAVRKGGAKRPERMAKEGQGAKAKGPSGTRGQKNAAPGRTHQDLAMRPAPQGGEGRGAGDSQIIDEGNIDILKGASGKIQDLLGNSAEKLGKGGSKLKGFGGFTTQGSGGLALQGSGSGGGGDAASLGGLSDKGRGGGRVGTGKGAAGTGSGLVGGQSRVVLRTGGPEESVVIGSIDKNAIWAAILAHRDEFRNCYEREVNAEDPSLAGQVVPSFTIGPSGRVTAAGVRSTSLNNANVERCVLGVLRRIEFPKPQGGGVVEVTFPFKFRRQ